MGNDIYHIDGMFLYKNREILATAQKFKFYQNCLQTEDCNFKYYYTKNYLVGCTGNVFDKNCNYLYSIYELIRQCSFDDKALLICDNERYIYDLRKRKMTKLSMYHTVYKNNKISDECSIMDIPGYKMSCVNNILYYKRKNVSGSDYRTKRRNWRMNICF